MKVKMQNRNEGERSYHLINTISESNILLFSDYSSEFAQMSNISMVQYLRNQPLSQNSNDHIIAVASVTMALLTNG